MIVKRGEKIPSIKSSKSLKGFGESSEDLKNNFDLSYKIESGFSVVQYSTCPNCFLEIDLKKLTSHIQSCKEKDIICSEVGCGCVIRNSILKRHLLEDCTVSIKRRQILKEKEDKFLLEKERKRKEKEDYEKEMERLRRERERLARELEEKEENFSIPSKTSVVTAVTITSKDKEIVLCKDCGESIRNTQV